MIAPPGDGRLCCEAGGEVLLTKSFSEESYRRALADWAWLPLAGHDRGDAGGSPHNGCVACLPDALIVSMFDGMGGLIVLDTAKQDASRESPVLVWTGAIDNPAAVEFLAPDYGSYALMTCENAIRYSRGEP